VRSLDPLILARLQFAFTVTFHIIFPTISIGLALFLVIVKGLWLKTGDVVYQQIYRFWLNIFAMSFAIGVVTGPGLMTFTRMLRPTSSADSVRASEMSAALLAA